MKIFTKSSIAFALLGFASVVNAQTKVEPVYEWVTVNNAKAIGWEWLPEGQNSEGKTQGSARTTDDGAYKVYVRSGAQAYAAGNGTDTDNSNPSQLKEDLSNYADWDSQFFIDFGEDNALVAGTKFSLSMQVKADAAQSGVATQSHNAPGGYMHYACVGNVDFTTSWAPFNSGELTVGDAPRTGMHTIAFNLSKSKDAANTYYFKDIVVKLQKKAWPKAPAGQMYEGCLLIKSGDALVGDNVHWRQMAVCNLPAALTSGSEYTLKVRLKTSNPGEGRTVQAIADCDGSTVWGAVFTPTDEFQEYSWTFTASGPHNKIKLSCGNVQGDLYIDDVSLKKTDSNEELISDGTFDADGVDSWSTENNPWGYDGTVSNVESEFYRTFVRDPNYSGGSLNIPDTDPIIVSAKSALLTAINKANNTELKGKTTASKNALAAAVAAGTVLVGNAGGTVADIDAAREAILTAIYELQDRTVPTAEKEVPKGWKSVITNGNLEGKDMSCFSAKVADAKDATECETADYEGIDDFHALFVQSNAAIKTQDWSDQLFITATETIPAGTKIHVEFDYRSDVEATAETQSHNLAGQYIHYAAIGNVNFKPEWQHFNYDGAVVAECNGGDNNGGYKNDFRTIAFNLSKNGKNTKFFIDNVVFWIELPKVQKQVLENGDLEGEETSNYMVKVYPSSAIVPATLTEGAGKDGSKGIKIDAPKKVSQDWDSQFWIQLPYESVPAGTSIKVKFDYKASAAASVDTQTHEAPGNYIHYAAIGTLNFTTDWKTFEGTFAVPSQCDGSDNSNGYKNNFRSIAFNLAKGTANDDVTFYFDNFSMTMDEEVADELTVVTGIKNVQPAAVKAGQYYDLLGRPVAQPRKGLYILNGQKVAVK